MAHLHSRFFVYCRSFHNHFREFYRHFAPDRPKLWWLSRMSNRWPTGFWVDGWLLWHRVQFFAKLNIIIYHAVIAVLKFHFLFFVSGGKFFYFFVSFYLFICTNVLWLFYLFIFSLFVLISFSFWPLATILLKKKRWDKKMAFLLWIFFVCYLY